MIDATDVYEYFLCPYKIYNKYNRDRKLMIPLTDFTKRLMKLGREHERKVVFGLKVAKIKYPVGNLQKGFLNTVKAMKLGKERIYQGVLMNSSFLGIPDLLIKQKGKSKFGDFYYMPADIKSSTNSKEEQMMQLMFYNMLLGKTQGTKPEKGVLVLKKSSEEVDLTAYEKKFEKALKDINELKNGNEFGLHIDSACKDCPWREVCFDIARKTNDVSLVYGMSRPVHYAILSQGIKTLEDIRKTASKKLAEITGFSEDVVNKWKLQTEVFLTNKEKIRKTDLPDTKHHICLDIETSEDGRLYLIGLWHRNKFVYFFSAKDEKKIVNDFVDYVLAMEDCLLYHYGTFEKTAFKQLFEKYNIDEDIRHNIFSKMIDLHQIVKKNAVLPLLYYNLKDVAKYFGFKWRASDASGSNSMIWYNEWLRKKDKKLFRKILNYNEDDVKATYVVLKKLANNKI